MTRALMIYLAVMLFLIASAAIGCLYILYTEKVKQKARRRRKIRQLERRREVELAGKELMRLDSFYIIMHEPIVTTRHKPVVIEKKKPIRKVYGAFAHMQSVWL